MRVFKHEDVSIPQTEKSKSNVNVVRMSAYCFSPKDQFLFVGLSNGKLFYYKKRNMEAR
jgi:hypothetical protein